MLLFKFFYPIYLFYVQNVSWIITSVNALVFSHNFYQYLLKKLAIDHDYYYRSQLIPVLSRLVEPIDGIDDQLIAQCFGLDPKGFKSKEKFNVLKNIILCEG